MPSLSGFGADTIGNWDTSTLIKFVRDLLESAPVTNFQGIKVENLDIVTQLTLRNKLVVAKDASIHYIGNVGQPAFTNSWVNFGSPYTAAGFFKDALGLVHLQGKIKSGTVGSAAFTLPPGYRPDSTHTFGTASNAAFGLVEVAADGTVKPITPSNNTYVSLGGLYFRAA